MGINVAFSQWCLIVSDVLVTTGGWHDMRFLHAILWLVYVWLCLIFVRPCDLLTLAFDLLVTNWSRKLLATKWTFFYTHQIWICYIQLFLIYKTDRRTDGRMQCNAYSGLLQGHTITSSATFESVLYWADWTNYNATSQNNKKPFT